MSEPNFHTTFFFLEGGGGFIGSRNEKIQMHVNKPVYLGPSILELSKIVMYEFLYDYVKPKYGEKLKLCYMDTDSFIVQIKTDDI